MPKTKPFVVFDAEANINNNNGNFIILYSAYFRFNLFQFVLIAVGCLSYDMQLHLVCNMFIALKYIRILCFLYIFRIYFCVYQPKPMVGLWWGQNGPGSRDTHKHIGHLLRGYRHDSISNFISNISSKRYF